MTSKLVGSVLILTFLAGGAALGQPFPPLGQVQISIWPEYDRPAALVIMTAWSPATASMPTTVALPMPTAAGMPSAVARRAADGSLLVANWTADEQGELTFVHIETDVPEVRIEFYADLEISDSGRKFKLPWPGGMEVGKLGYEVMQPLGSSGMTINPPATAQRLGTDGLTYFFADLGTKSPADAFSIELSYTKTGSELTAAALQPTFLPPPDQQAEPAAQPAQPPTEDDSMWLVMLPVVLAVAGIVAWFLWSDRRAKK
jgi:hypothetical protein